MTYVLSLLSPVQLRRVQPVEIVLLSSDASSSSSSAPQRLNHYAQSLPSLVAKDAPPEYEIQVAVSQSWSAALRLPHTASPHDIDAALLPLSPQTTGTEVEAEAVAPFTLPTLRFFLIPAPAMSSSSSSPVPSWYMGEHHHGWRFLPSLSEAELQTATEQLTQLLQHLLSFHRNASSDPRVLKYSTAYRLSFTLLTALPEPAAFGWDFESASQQLLEPLLSSLSHILSLSVDSQSLQYADIIPRPTFSSSTSCPALLNGSVQFIRADQLRNFVGSTRWNVASPLVMEAVELVAFVPKQDDRPLVVRGDGDDAESFIVPQWGAVLIVNSPEGVERGGGRGAAIAAGGRQTVQPLDDEAMLSVMERFIAIIRILLGLQGELQQPSPPSSSSSASAPAFTLLPAASALADWEQSALLSRFVSLSVQSVLHDLRGLYQLVDSVPHMPVSDDIAALVATTIAHMGELLHSCSTHRYAHCGQAAIAASSSSHAAFYAHSLLPSLYFPEEHLYAVYAPLFLPISLPVIAALLARLRQWRQARRKGKGSVAVVEEKEQRLYQSSANTESTKQE